MRLFRCCFRDESEQPLLKQTPVTSIASPSQTRPAIQAGHAVQALSPALRFSQMLVPQQIEQLCKEKKFKIAQLNSGGSAIIFHLIIGDQQYAVKVPLENSENLDDLFNTERKAYREIGKHRYFLTLVEIFPIELRFLQPINLLLFPYLPNAKDLFDFHYDSLDKMPDLKEQLKVYQIILAQIIAALEYLHENGKNLRDLKPENVLVCEDYRVKLIDLPLLTPRGRETKWEGTGTTAYHPPEFAEAKRNGLDRVNCDGVDAWCFMLIVTFLFFDPPFDPENVRHLRPSPRAEVLAESRQFLETKTDVKKYSFATQLRSEEKQKIFDLIGLFATLQARAPISAAWESSFFKGIDPANYRISR